MMQLLDGAGICGRTQAKRSAWMRESGPPYLETVPLNSDQRSAIVMQHRNNETGTSSAQRKRLVALTVHFESERAHLIPLEPICIYGVRTLHQRGGGRATLSRFRRYLFKLRGATATAVIFNGTSGTTTRFRARQTNDDVITAGAAGRMSRLAKVADDVIDGGGGQRYVLFGDAGEGTAPGARRVPYDVGVSPIPYRLTPTVATTRTRATVSAVYRNVAHASRMAQPVSGPSGAGVEVRRSEHAGRSERRQRALKS